MASESRGGAAKLALDELLRDGNDDGYPDDIRARIVLDGTPEPELWAAILDLAARLGLETSGFTPPLITPAPTPAQLPIVVRNGDAQAPVRLASGWQGQGREAIVAAGPNAVEQLARLGQEAATPGETPSQPPATLDLRDLFETNGLLVDGGDGLPLGTRLTIVIPPGLPVFVGRALADFVARLGVESGGVTFPVATTGEPPAWAIPLRLNLRPGAETELRVVSGPALELAGDPEQAAYLIDTLARDWPRLPGLPAASEAVDWLRRSLAGWTPAGRAALLRADLRDLGAESGPVRLLVADQRERAALRQTAQQALGPDAEVREPENALLVMHDEWSAPWEVERALAALRDTILPQLAPATPVELTIFVSEPAGVRRALAGQASQILDAAGFPGAEIQVLDAFKPGLCWLREVVLPRWRALRDVAGVVVRYRTFEQQGDQALDYPIRWLQELFPADEFVAEALGIPLEAVALEEWDGPATYAVEALDGAGQVLAHEELTLFSYERPYLDAYRDKGTVTVTTGGVAARQGERVVREAVATDLDEFWGFFQGVVLPRLGAAILQASGGDPRAADQPLFDRLDIEVTLSATDETLGIREEWNSAAEALHEDIYFVALDYVEALGEQINGERLSGPGSVVPVVHVRPGAGPSATVTLRARAGAVARIEGEGEPRPLGVIGSVPAGEARVTAVGVTGDHLWLKIALTGLDATARRTLATLGVLRPPKRGRANIQVTLDQRTSLLLDPPDSDALPAVEPARLPTPDGEIVTEANLYPLLARLAGRPEVRVALAERSYQGRPIPAIEVSAPVTADVWSARKLSLFKPTLLVVARHHANEVAATSAALKLVERLTEDPDWRPLLQRVNVAVIPYENPDGAELHALLQEEHPTWKHHPARYNAVGLEISLDRGKPDSRYGEARVRDTLWRRWLPDAVVDNHGFNSHEWVQPFSGYGAAVRFRTYWIVPSIVWGASGYLDDPRFPEHRQATEAVREAVTLAMAADDELLALNRRYFERFETWARGRLPDKYPTERHHEMIFYSRPLGERRRWGGYTVDAPRVTVFTSITEVPDETAHGAHLERTARADLVNNRAILELLAAAAEPPRRTIVAGPDSLRISLARRRPIRLSEPASFGEGGGRAE